MNECIIKKTAKIYPNYIAIETNQIHLSYAELDHLLDKTAAYLLSSISSKMIAILSHPTLDTILLYFGALRAGLSVAILSHKEPNSSLQSKLEKLPTQTLTELPDLKKIEESHLSQAPLGDTYLFTSGSTSEPKIVVLSYANHYYSALGIVPYLHLTSKDRYLLSLPLYHVSGLSILFRTFLQGATLVLNSIEEAKDISHLSLVLTQYVKFLETPLAPNLKAILLGGSPIPSRLLEEGLKQNLPLYLGYGLTEMASTVTCKKVELNSMDSSGSTLPFRKVSICEDGSICVSGATMAKGYYSPITKTVESFGEYFSTKDLGYLSQNGELFFQGREDFLIISGGENIQPEEIEKHLINLPFVEHAAIVSTTHPIYGEALVAIVATNKPINEETFQQKLSSILPRFKLPKYYLPWPAAITTSSKISSAQRIELKKYATQIALSSSKKF